MKRRHNWTTPLHKVNYQWKSLASQLDIWLISGYWLETSGALELSWCVTVRLVSSVHAHAQQLCSTTNWTFLAAPAVSSRGQCSDSSKCYTHVCQAWCCHDIWHQSWCHHHQCWAGPAISITKCFLLDAIAPMNIIRSEGSVGPDWLLERSVMLSSPPTSLFAPRCWAGPSY